MVARLTGGMTPKSLTASPTGVVTAQNMIYGHSISVFDADRRRIATVDDTIVPARYGHTQWPAPVRGGPVEAVFSPDGRHLWVSNYSMYGPGFDRPGDDVCSPAVPLDRSFVYRVDTESWQVDGAVLVGSVPKYVAVTPDGSTLLVTNWCSWDLSVVDTATLKQVARIPIGRYPRGIAVHPDGRQAYVAVMGGTEVREVDLAAVADGRRGDGVTRRLATVGGGPRHLVLSPDGRQLYVTLNRDGDVAKVDVHSGRVVARVATGAAPRSAVLDPEGRSLFVVNYESDTVSRIRTSDMSVVEARAVDHHPIGITYNAARRQVWVCSYVGSVTVLADGG